MENAVKAFAIRQGYDTAKRRGEWKGFIIYEPVLSTPGARVGLPHFILVKGDKIRMSTNEEAFDIFDSFM